MQLIYSDLNKNNFIICLMRIITAENNENLKKMKSTMSVCITVMIICGKTWLIVMKIMSQ